jgi:hypothetical protein
MPLKHLAIGLAIATAISAAVTTAQAGELYIPFFTYRTGPFSGGGYRTPMDSPIISPCSTSATAGLAVSS